VYIMLKRIFRAAIQKSPGKEEKLSSKCNNAEETDKTNDKTKTFTTIPTKETILHPTVNEQKTEGTPITVENNKDIISPNPTEEQIELEKHKQTNHHKIEKKLLEHCFIAEKLTSSTNWEPTNNTFSEILLEWANLDIDNNYPELKERFNEAYYRFKKRYDSHINIKQLIAAREQICDEIETLTQCANTESAANSIRDIQNIWTESENIPPRFFEILDRKYNKLITKFNEAAERLKAEAKAEEARELAEAEERSKIIEKEKSQQSSALSLDEKKEFTVTIEELCNQLKKHIDTDNT
jgi:hypothetical protein